MGVGDIFLMACARYISVWEELNFRLLWAELGNLDGGAQPNLAQYSLNLVIFVLNGSVGYSGAYLFVPLWSTPS
jgi:hypothetical protein